MTEAWSTINCHRQRRRRAMVHRYAGNRHHNQRRECKMNWNDFARRTRGRTLRIWAGIALAEACAARCSATSWHVPLILSLQCAFRHGIFGAEDLDIEAPATFISQPNSTAVYTSASWLHTHTCENRVRRLRTFFTVVLEPNIHTFSVLSETLPDFLKSKLC